MIKRTRVLKPGVEHQPSVHDDEGPAVKKGHASGAGARGPRPEARQDRPHAEAGEEHAPLVPRGGEELLAAGQLGARVVPGPKVRGEPVLRAAAGPRQDIHGPAHAKVGEEGRANPEGPQAALRGQRRLAVHAPHHGRHVGLALGHVVGELVVHRVRALP